MDFKNDSLSLSNAVERIKSAILQSQQQAVQDLNINLLSLYFAIGEFISLNTRQQQWGSNALKTISDQLQKELPGLRGYSETNLKNMRIFYEAWSPNIIRQPAADELELTNNEKDIVRQPTADELQQTITCSNLQL